MHPGSLTKLSDRQLDCLRLVGQLKKTEQIAAELGISPSTVNTHIERAITILGANSRREAARLVQLAETGRPEKIPTELPRLSPPAAPIPSVEAPATIGTRQRNDLSTIYRLAFALICLALLCIAIGGLGAAIEQLSDWQASLAK